MGIENLLAGPFRWQACFESRDGRRLATSRARFFFVGCAWILISRPNMRLMTLLFATFFNYPFTLNSTKDVKRVFIVSEESAPEKTHQR